MINAKAIQNNLIRLARSAEDVRIKRLYTVEAERWLRLSQLKRPVESDGGLIAAE
jgi:hypothetical protein